MLIIKLLKKKDPDNTFVKLWENKRYHALVCLGLWFIFFIFVFLIVVIPYNNALKNLPKNNETENIITFASMKEKLLNSEYNYKYTVNTSLGKTVYTGTKTKENITGYRENSEGLIKYEINNEGIFQINMDEKIPLENLYLGLNENYLDIQKIYDLSSTLTENINEEENEIIYENDNIGIKFKIDEQNILSINIKDNSDNYLLEFDNIK